MGDRKKTSVIFRFRDLQKEIQSYGYEYTAKNYIVYLVGVIFVTLLMSYCMRIKAAGVVGILIAAVVATPLLILYHYKTLYEQKRFSEAVDYMEYMIYGFLRMPKILSALEEAEKLCHGNMKLCIEKAVDRIRYAKLYQDIYTDALANIEHNYNNDRMTELHRFLIQVEHQGGDYKKSLEVLLEDIRQWSEMVYSLQQERKALQNKVAISICLSMVTAITMVSLLPQDIGDIAQNTLYQCSSVVFVLCSFFVYIMSQKTLVRSWLSGEEDTREIERAYDFCLKHIESKNRHYKFQEKKVVRHIKKEFPVWLRNVVLNMSTENVFVAMEKAAKNCSVVLRSELEKALAEVEKTPGSMKAYQSFLENFKIPEIKNVFLMFYSFSEFGTKEAEGQMNSLIKRNKKLAEQSERLINEDSLGIFGLYMLCPMILAAAKMLMDMWVFVQQFLFFYSNVIG